MRLFAIQRQNPERKASVNTVGDELGVPHSAYDKKKEKRRK